MAAMKVIYFQLSLVGLLLRSPALLFKRIAQDPWYWGGITEWINGQSIPSGARVLELGCGPGALAIDLARRAYHVTAVDHSKHMLACLAQAAKTNGVCIDSQAVDIYDTGLPSAFFDAVIGASILNVVTRPADLIAEALRLTKPGGMLSFYLPNTQLNRSNIKRFIRQHQLAAASAAILLTWGRHATKLSDELAVTLLRQAGVEQISLRTYFGGMVSSVSGLRPFSPVRGALPPC
jgi:2-polyprenyl-3-methyl-5-hydroxy-6-metoxy-1,4-benzoquinol methylase